MVQLVTTSTDYDALINSSEVVLVDFFAIWCGPCRMVAPIIEKMEEEYEAEKKNVKFLKVDVDAMRELSEKLSISAMPTFLVYHNGVLKKTIVGANVPLIQSVVAELSTDGSAIQQEPVVA